MEVSRLSQCRGPAPGGAVIVQPHWRWYVSGGLHKSLGLILAPCSWVSDCQFLLILVNQSIHLGRLLLTKQKHIRLYSVYVKILDSSLQRGIKLCFLIIQIIRHQSTVIATLARLSRRCLSVSY